MENATIEELIEEYGQDVLRTAYLYVKDYHLAQDIFQDVFIKVNEKFINFRRESSIKTWIIRITINTCKDYIKSAYAKRVVPMMEFLQEKNFNNGNIDLIEQKDQNRIIREAVMNLSEKYRDILICVYFQELSVKETAFVLKLSEGTVKSRLSRGRDKLKKYLEGRL